MKDAVPFKKKIEEAPQQPGVYIFRSSDGRYIYIGKAKNLKKRLKGHYQQLRYDPKEQRIFSESDILEWIITKSDYEAFVLENELIKQYKPRYNIRLKSGSGYPMLVITDEEYPTVLISRKYGEIKGEYFGPFLPARTARAMKDLIHKLFKLRTCDPMPKRDVACFDYHLGLCSAPCTGKISKKDYNFDVKGAKAFLSGNVKKFIYQLYDRIEEYKQKMLFEKAAVVRDQITAMENLVHKQEVLGLPFEEGDILFFGGGEILLIVVRGYRIVGKEFLQLKGEGLKDEFVSKVLTEYYSKGNYIPSRIFINQNVEEKENIIRWLSDKKGSKVVLKTEIPEEIRQFIDRNFHFVDLDRLRNLFRKVFGFELPERIEGFDISTLQGSFTVGSCVVWEDGRMNKREYRRFKVKTVKGIDDYASLREVLYRRFKRYTEMETFPLVLIDGGKGQLKQGLTVRDALNLENLRIFSIAKKEEILFTDDGREIKLFEFQELLKLFTQIRDEAHRFAVSYNRKLREKEGLKEVLDKIEGVGKKRKEILYRTYKTLDRISQASVEELKKLGIPENVAQNIKKYLSD
ncbi:excinuclease ABC subunit UvrC [Persephonella atlantica]|uniref:UvrABC system protein C n=1 Tax=Persephonella atlantica TaxID=2699429 RepID=A0ABS1GFH1_9AQUI|nr:excinuclease ABC subunit UvrC [Persephonella atlantica]MBK3331668.1 excinuclease ABC subunit UvrC [Persephonella atlantica]